MRTKQANAPRQHRLVSIPKGAIMSVKGNKRKNKANLVSIPKGAIMSFLCVHNFVPLLSFNSKRCDYEKFPLRASELSFAVSIPKGAIMRSSTDFSKLQEDLFQFQKVRL